MDISINNHMVMDGTLIQLIQLLKVIICMEEVHLMMVIQFFHACLQLKLL